MKRSISAFLVILLAVSQFIWAAHACPLDAIDQSAELLSVVVEQAVLIDEVGTGDQTEFDADHDAEQCDVCDATLAATTQSLALLAPIIAPSDSGSLAALPRGALDRLQNRPPILPTL